MNHQARPNRERGQAVVLLVITLGLFVLGALGLGIDGAQMYAHRQMAQAAADAAAQAAVMSILRGTNSTSAHPFPTASSFTCTVPPAALDLRTPCVYAQYNGFGTSADTVTVSFPATVSGVSLSSSPTPGVSVKVQRVLTAGLIRFAGISTYAVSAKATAGLLGSVPTNCVYVLDPAARDAFQVSGGVTVTMNCGIVINDGNAEAALVTGGSRVTASAFSVSGGFTVNGGSTSSPSPTSGTPVVADPFASLPAPAYSTCNFTNYSAGYGARTLNPGTYCGGMTFGGGGTSTFNSGIYIINGGGVQFGNGVTINGSGVMFYLTGTNSSYASINIQGGTTATLSAPTSGAYTGVLFFQDRSIVTAAGASFSGGATMNLSGSLYFPTTSVSYSGGASTTGTAAIVAQQVSFTGGTNLKYDPTGLKTGLVSQTAAMIE